MAGQTLSGVDQLELESSLRDAITAFEPRLNPDRLHLRISTVEGSRTRNALIIDIDAELWAHPLPIPLLLRTELDLEDGSVTVEDVRRDERR